MELTGLEPGTYYEFRFGEESRVFRFRTMPGDALQPIRFAAGGDVRHEQRWMERTNSQVLKYDPEFVLWGGDLAYADGREDRVNRWYEFFDAMKNTLITEEGRVIPAVAGLGNHEVQGGYYYNTEGFEPTDEWRETISPYFYALLAFPGQPGYNVLDFADYLSIIVLDSDHNNPIEGAQTEWLEQVLSERQHVPHVFPIYHVPAFPSHRDYHSDVITRVRETWTPLFEQYGVQVAFENHDHTYKRTPPIRNGTVDPGGVVYLGDGAWGVRTRDYHPPDETWYLERVESVRHFILVTIQGRHQTFTVVDEDGNIIDRYPESE